MSGMEKLGANREMKNLVRMYGTWNCSIDVILSFCLSELRVMN